MSSTTDKSRVRHPRLFDDVLCGVDGTRGAYEAVRQAAVLAGPQASLTLLAVTALEGAGRQRSAAISPERARRALDRARDLAGDAGVETVAIEIDERPPMPETLLKRAAEHGILAIGAPYMSRAAHILVGGTASKAAHSLPVSLLVARKPAVRGAFGEQMIVATDGSPRSDGLVDFAIGLARERAAALTLVHAIPGEESDPAIAAQVTRLVDALGANASVRIERERARKLILATAEAQGCSLIIVASRRLRGLAALGSLSERLVHDAACSVLVLRPEDTAPAA